MAGKPMPIRAIPKMGGPDWYLDTTKLTFDQRRALEDELDQRGFYVQYVHFDDPMTLLIEGEIRKRLEAEQQEARKG